MSLTDRPGASPQQAGRSPRAGQRPSPDGAGPDAGANRKRRSRRRRIALIAFQAVVVAIAVGVLTHRSGSLANVAHLLRHVRWRWVVAALASEAAAIVSLGALQRQLMACGGVRVGLRRMTSITLASNAVAQSVPAGAVVAEGYVYRRYRSLGATPVVSLWVGLSSGALAAAALAGVALAGALLTGGSLGLSLAPVAAFVLVGAATVAALFRRCHVLALMVRGVLKQLRPVLPDRLARAAEAGARHLDEMDAMHPSTRAWATAGGLAGANWLFDCLTMAWAMKAVEVPVPWRAVLLAFAAGQLLAMFPITPGGLGIVEGGLAVVLVRLGEPASAATAGTLAYRAMSFWTLVAAGWVAVALLAFRERRAGRDAAQSGKPAAARA